MGHGNYGIFLIMGSAGAGFCPSTVVLSELGLNPQRLFWSFACRLVLNLQGMS